jgi:hypothetical protein
MNNTIKVIPRVAFTVNAELSENELRALDALVGYGIDPFLKMFYEKLGKAYLEPFENDLRQLFIKIESLRPAISEINEARKKLNMSIPHP